MTSQEIKDRLAMDNAYEKAEFHAKRPNSSEERRLVYAAYHGCIARMKGRLKDGDPVLALEWYRMAETILHVCLGFNPSLHFDPLPPRPDPSVVLSEESTSFLPSRQAPDWESENPEDFRKET